MKILSILAAAASLLVADLVVVLALRGHSIAVICLLLFLSSLIFPAFLGWLLLRQSSTFARAVLGGAIAGAIPFIVIFGTLSLKSLRGDKKTPEFQMYAIQAVATALGSGVVGALGAGVGWRLGRRKVEIGHA